ncbi:MAG TPA: hypothetical protein VJU78_07120 [Chitinophagaceae bacterium]|nr:hypothetical protein [Chitinophagaceae bacterium]
MTLKRKCNYKAHQSLNKSKQPVSRFHQFYFQAILVIAAFLFYTGMANGQRINESSARNAVYIDLASRGPIYSINYDRIFRQGEKVDYSFNAGFSIAKNAVSFPVGIHFITTNSDHHAELGVTFIPYIEQKPALAGSAGKGDVDKYLYINPGIGYRYQKSTGGIFLKAAVGPSVFLDPPSDDFWKMDPKLYAFGSIGVGISF